MSPDYSRSTKPRRVPDHLHGDLVKHRVQKEGEDGSDYGRAPKEVHGVERAGRILRSKFEAFYEYQAHVMDDPGLTKTEKAGRVAEALRKLEEKGEEIGAKATAPVLDAMNRAVRNAQDELRPRDQATAQELRSVLRGLSPKERAGFVSELESEGGDGLRAIVSADRRLSGMDEQTHAQLHERAVKRLAPDAAREHELLSAGFDAAKQLREAFYGEIGRVKEDLAKHQGAIQASRAARAGAENARARLEGGDGSDAA